MIIYKEINDEIIQILEKMLSTDTRCGNIIPYIVEIENCLLNDFDISIYVEGDYCLPVKRINDIITNNPIDIIIGDGCIVRQFPFYNTDKLNRFGFTILENSRGEYIIDIRKNSFDLYLDSISIVSRCWNKRNDFKFTISKGFDTHSFFKGLPYYNFYWNNIKTNTIKNKHTVPLDYYYYSSLQKENVLSILMTDLYDKFVASAFFMVDGKELYWSITLRNYNINKPAVGNLILLKALEYAYYNSFEIFNLGLDFFSYKLLWKPERIPVKGIKRI